MSATQLSIPLWADLSAVAIASMQGAMVAAKADDESLDLLGVGLVELVTVGIGPSSSHTVEPRRAAVRFKSTLFQEAPMTQNFTLTLSCPQRPGIVHAVSSFLFSRRCDIAEHQQFDDPVGESFFLAPRSCAETTPSTRRS